MESNDTFNCAVRVKQEPIDMSPDDNEDYQTIDKAPDVQNVEFSQFMHGNSIQKLKQEYDETTELNEDMEIIFECKDVKPDTGLLVVKKMEDYSENHLQNMIFRHQTQKTIKVENVGVVKEEFVSAEAEKLTMNSDCELNKPNDKRRVEKTSIYKHRLNTPIDKVNSSISCDTCGLKFTTKPSLKRHNDTKHKGIRHACNECGKSFTHKGQLKMHVDSKHNGILHACDICGKSFSRKWYLKIHINSVHNKVNHTCNLCEKKFSDKNSLKLHNGAKHKGIIRHACNVCEKSFTQRKNLKRHIDSMHNGVTYACDECGKSFTRIFHLKNHIETVHNGVTHSCNQCGKSFSHKCNLKRHIDKGHNGVRYACDKCKKKFSEKSSLERHIDSAHNSVSMRYLQKESIYNGVIYECN